MRWRTAGRDLRGPCGRARCAVGRRSGAARRRRPAPGARTPTESSITRVVPPAGGARLREAFEQLPSFCVRASSRLETHWSAPAWPRCRRKGQRHEARSSRSAVREAALVGASGRLHPPFRSAQHRVERDHGLPVPLPPQQPLHALTLLEVRVDRAQAPWPGHPSIQSRASRASSPRAGRQGPPLRRMRDLAQAALPTVPAGKAQLLEREPPPCHRHLSDRKREMSCRERVRPARQPSRHAAPRATLDRLPLESAHAPASRGCALRTIPPCPGTPGRAPSVASRRRRCPERLVLEHPEHTARRCGSRACRAAVLLPSVSDRAVFLVEPHGAQKPAVGRPPRTRAA